MTWVIWLNMNWVFNFKDVVLDYRTSWIDTSSIIEAHPGSIGELLIGPDDYSFFNAGPLDWHHVISDCLVRFTDCLFIILAFCYLVACGVMQKVLIAVLEVSLTLIYVLRHHCSHYQHIFVWNEGKCIPLIFVNVPTSICSKVREPLENFLSWL